MHSRAGKVSVGAEGLPTHTFPVELNSFTLKAIEKKDADRDEFSNIAEIKAGTLPGDPKSKPKCK